MKMFSQLWLRSRKKRLDRSPEILNELIGVGKDVPLANSDMEPHDSVN